MPPSFTPSPTPSPPSTNHKPVRVGAQPRWWNIEDLLLIILVAVVLYLPGLGKTCLFDRDEPRFAQAGDMMLRTGDWIVPRYYSGDIRPDKPPLLYWLMTATYSLAGVDELGARLPSVILSTGTLLVVYWMAGRRFGRVTGFMAALILGSCVLFIAEARLATADATMVFFTTLAMACLWRAWDAGAKPAGLIPKAQFLVDRGGPGIIGSATPPPAYHNAPIPWAVALGFWVALAAGILAKGVPLLIVTLSVLALAIATGVRTDLWPEWKSHPGPWRFYHFPQLLIRCVTGGNYRWLRGLRPLLGVPLLLVLVGWWFVAAWIKTDGHLIETMLGRHVRDRVLTGLESHGAPPGTYTLAVWLTFWPWSVLLVGAAVHTWRRVMNKTPILIDPRPYQFLVAWLLPSWIAYECFMTKLVHYVLPMYIPLAILCADALVQGWHRLSDVTSGKGWKVARWIWVAAWGAFAVVLLAYTWGHFPAEANHQIFWRCVPVAGALVATGVAGAIAWWKPAWPFVTVLGFSVALLLANMGVVPEIQELRAGKLAAYDLNRLREAGYTLYAAGYDEPSLLFYTGPGLTVLNAAPGEPDVITQIKGLPANQHWGIVASKDVLNALIARKVDCRIMDTFTTAALARGRVESIYVLLNTTDFPSEPATRPRR